MSCDIIIPVYNQLNYTKACLDSIKEHTDCQHRIIVVDDASDQDTAGYLDRLSSSGEIVLLRNENNLGWLKSVNKGIEYSKAEYVCVMNNDTLVYPGWLSEMVKIAEKNAQIGIVNPLWELPKTFFGTRNAYFRAIVSKQKSKFVETDWARGFCFLTKRAVIEKIGGLNEVFSPRYFEDWDYSIRAINAGFICVRALGAFVWHHKNITYENVFGKSGMNKEFEEKRKIFCARWGEPLRILLISDSSLEN
jgi:GT2 family glycosyltransferase